MIEKVKFGAEESLRLAMKDRQDKLQETRSHFEMEKANALKAITADTESKLQRLKEACDRDKEKALSRMKKEVDELWEQKVKTSVKTAVQLEQEVFCQLQMEFKSTKRKWSEERERFNKINEEKIAKYALQIKEQTEAFHEKISNVNEEYEKKVSYVLH